jgi:3-oxoacyl-[acyl-carrier-protein] synthase-3
MSGYSNVYLYLFHESPILDRWPLADSGKPQEEPNAGKPLARICEGESRMAQLLDIALAYLIGHTTSPARLAPPNIALVADRWGFSGLYMELRQSCTGFANALVIAQGLTAVPGVKAVGIVGSETGSVSLIRDVGARTRVNW